MNKDNFITVPEGGKKSRARLNDLYYAGLTSMAEMEGLNISEAIRMAIREACLSRGLWPPKKEK